MFTDIYLHLHKQDLTSCASEHACTYIFTTKCQQFAVTPLFACLVGDLHRKHVFRPFKDYFTYCQLGPAYISWPLTGCILDSWSKIWYSCLVSLTFWLIDRRSQWGLKCRSLDCSKPKKKKKMTLITSNFFLHLYQRVVEKIWIVPKCNITSAFSVCVTEHWSCTGIISWSASAVSYMAHDYRLNL